MTKPTEPKIPEGLLERCFSTIPESATTTYRPSLSPDSASRTRLRWLAVAAAVPVVMVIAVLPIRYWVAQQTLSKSASGQTNFITDAAKKRNYICIKSWRIGFNTDFKSMSVVPSRAGRRYSVKVMQRDKGIYNAYVESDYKTLLKPTISYTDHGTLVGAERRQTIDPWDQPVYGCSLELVNGDLYEWDGKTVSNEKIYDSKGAWAKKYDSSLDWAVLKTLDKPREDIIVEKPKVFSGTWKGKPVIIIQYSTRSKKVPSRKLMVAQYRSQFFLSQTDNLVLGKRLYLRAVGSDKEVFIEEAEYDYTPSEDELQHLNPASFPKQ